MKSSEHIAAPSSPEIHARSHKHIMHVDDMNPSNGADDRNQPEHVRKDGSSKTA